MRSPAGCSAMGQKGRRESVVSKEPHSNQMQHTLNLNMFLQNKPKLTQKEQNESRRQKQPHVWALARSLAHSLRKWQSERSHTAAFRSLSGCSLQCTSKKKKKKKSSYPVLLADCESRVSTAAPQLLRSPSLLCAGCVPLLQGAGHCMLPFLQVCKEKCLQSLTSKEFTAPPI